MAGMITHHSCHLPLPPPSLPPSRAHSPIDNAKFVTEVAAPAQISDLTFFLLPNIQLPVGAGVVLYYSLAPFTEWSVLGALTLTKPR